jgi:hypothetical protein
MVYARFFEAGVRRIFKVGNILQRGHIAYTNSQCLMNYRRNYIAISVTRQSYKRTTYGQAALAQGDCDDDHHAS